VTRVLITVDGPAQVTDRPSIIKVTTTIGYGSKMQGTEHVHGAPLKKDDLAELKKKVHLPIFFF
jgi:transketolase